MELIVFVLLTATKVVLNLLLIATMAIPAGFGLAIGYKLGKAFYATFGRQQVKKHTDEFAAMETGEVC